MSNGVFVHLYDPQTTAENEADIDIEMAAVSTMAMDLAKRRSLVIQLMNMGMTGTEVGDLAQRIEQQVECHLNV